MALELEQTDGADELGLERRPELVAAAQDDLGDRVRVAGIGLAGPQSATIAMRAPGRHVENLKAGARQCRRQRPPEPGRFSMPMIAVAASCSTSQAIGAR